MTPAIRLVPKSRTFHLQWRQIKANDIYKADGGGRFIQ